MRCLAALAEWESLSTLCRTEWSKSEPHMRREMALIAAHAAWQMGCWDEMAAYVDAVDAGEAAQAATATGAFLRSVLCVRRSQYDAARTHVERARELMSTELAALVGESYERAYTDMIRVQQLAELEEAIEYKRAVEARGGGGGSGSVHAQQRGGAEGGASAATARIAFIKQLWTDRLKGVQKNVEARAAAALGCAKKGARVAAAVAARPMVFAGAQNTDFRRLSPAARIPVRARRCGSRSSPCARWCCPCTRTCATGSSSRRCAASRAACARRTACCCRCCATTR
jgi:hypothetical protein